MTAPHVPQAAPPLPSTQGTAVGGSVTFTGVLRSELTKLRSVRSTYWTLFAALVFTIVIGWLASAVAANTYRHHDVGRDFDPMGLTFVGLNLAQLAVGVLGVLAITSEYSTGMIRATFTAVPQRMKLLAAKATAFSIVTAAASVIMCVIVFFIGQANFGGAGLHYSLSNFAGQGPAPGRALIGAVLYLVVSGLLGFALGALIRRTPGAIVALVVLQFVVVGILAAIASAAKGFWWTIWSWMPTVAGEQVFSVVYTEHTITHPWGGFAVMVGWVVLLLLAAFLLVERRDA
ncbi:MAG: ABC transporter permease [Acidimicrobiales bacterium]